MSPGQVSRGFHRLGIFAALLVFVTSVVIGSGRYDPSGWWLGGVVLAFAAYGLSRLLGWSINGFGVQPAAEPVPAAAAAARIEPTFPAGASLRANAKSVKIALSPDTRWPISPDGSPPTIGGWLILPAITTFVSPFILAKTLYDLAPALNVLSHFNGDLQALVVISWGVNLALAVAWAYACYLLVNRKSAFPAVFMSLMIVGALVVSADLIASVKWLATPIDPSATRDLVRAAAGVVIWVPYMLRSKRVAATFVG